LALDTTLERVILFCTHASPYLQSEDEHVHVRVSC
jgi:hypothetical protein